MLKLKHNMNYLNAGKILQGYKFSKYVIRSINAVIFFWTAQIQAKIRVQSNPKDMLQKQFSDFKKEIERDKGKERRIVTLWASYSCNDQSNAKMSCYQIL